jgi:CRISPR-associated endoribonuclease Cas6/Csy4 subtype I-F
MGTLITRLHGFMVSKEVRFAVAFPRYKAGEYRKIGEVIRFFGSPDSLNNLLDDLEGDERERWICGRVRETPEYTSQAIYSRLALPPRPTPDQARFADYMMKRRTQMLSSMEALPFFFVKSQSGETHFPVTVEKQTIKGPLDVVQGAANAYGFSTKTQAVPLPEFW